MYNKLQFWPMICYVIRIKITDVLYKCIRINLEQDLTNLWDV